MAEKILSLLALFLLLAVLNIAHVYAASATGQFVVGPQNQNVSNEGKIETGTKTTGKVTAEIETHSLVQKIKLFFKNIWTKIFG